MKITAHVLVKNEVRFLWYSVMSALPYVDKLLLWDTGSTDGTREIIDEILKTPAAKNKIVFESHASTLFNEEFLRQKMLDATKTEWFIVIDGDEIWWHDSLRIILHTIETDNLGIESIVVPTINAVGDIYHYQEDRAGNYRLAGRVGHLNIRVVNRNIPGLHSLGRHGIWGWVDQDNVQIQDRDQKRVHFVDAPYFHATYLQRSVNRAADAKVTKRSFKYKYEIGIAFPYDFFYPESFFIPRPDNIPFIWEEMSTIFRLRAQIETPLRKVKRRLLPRKIGY